MASYKTAILSFKPDARAVEHDTGSLRWRIIDDKTGETLSGLFSYSSSREAWRQAYMGVKRTAAQAADARQGMPRREPTAQNRYLPAGDDFHGLCDHLQEECAELIKEIAKMKRFGSTGKNPDTGEANRAAVIREYDDVVRAMSRLRRNNVMLD